MNKLLLIIKREYLAKVRNKSFVVMTFLTPILMVGMFLLVAYLANMNDNDKRTIVVLNESHYFSTDFLSTENTSYVNFKDLSLQQAKDSVMSLEYYGLLHIPNHEDLEKVASTASFYTTDSPNAGVLNTIESIFESRLRAHRLLNMELSAEDFSILEQPFEVHTANFIGEENVKGANIMKAFIGGGFGYLIMMFIIIYGGFVMRSVIEEKTSRIIEVIISSVKPFQLMMGKIIGTSFAGITQFIIWVISASILLTVAVFVFNIDVASLGVTSKVASGSIKEMSSLPVAMDENMILYIKEFVNIPWASLIVFFIVYFILGYLIYSSIYAAIGAAVDNETDTQQFIFPVILPLMLAVYVGFFSVFENPHGPVAVGFSLFPLTSPIVMLMRLPNGIGEGGVPLWQLVTSVFFLIVAFIGIVWLAAKIYRVGILMYGKKPTYKELFKWLRY